MTEKNRFHLSSGAAESYDQQKVPALFGPMAEAMLDLVALPPSARVLDVACGTGAVTRAVAERLVEPSSFSGADLNPAMIEVAGRQSPSGFHSFEWVTAPAEEMPFEDASFDLAFCQQGLQFFPDKLAALTEIHRVLVSGGRLILSCWAEIPPFFLVIAETLDRHLGAAAASKAVEPFVWNDSLQITQLIEAAGFDAAAPQPLPVMRHLAASPETIRKEILASPNEQALRAAGEETLDKIVSEILLGVDHFRVDEMLVMPQQGHLFSAVVGP